ncbi:MAG TPA: sulfatase [Candidatus Paceibacterota bacterium]|nr:sulfatase [Candidatus Paceibacterota bacterium]
MHLHPRIKHHARRIHHHFRIALLLIPLVLFAGYLCISYLLPTKPAKPLNVILISIDSLRADHMGIYGYSRDTTPHIDKWSKEAVVFNNYFSTSHLTPISEVSVHTGKYPFTTGVVNFQETLPTSTPNLARLLKDHGYQTAAFGTSPEFKGYNAGHSLSRGFDRYVFSEATASEFNGRDKNLIGDSIDWISVVSASSSPFFLWLPIGSVHWPYGQSEPHHFSSSTYDGYFKTASKNTWKLVDHLFENTVFARRGPQAKFEPIAQLGKNDFDFIVGRYDDGILMTDRRIGQLFSFLKESGIDKNTIVILESEHGEGLNERGYVLHYDIFDEQTHTPLIIKSPMLNPGRIDGLVSGVDIIPTLLALLTFPQIETEGYDLSPYIMGRANNPREAVYITRTSMWERVMSYYEGLEGFLALDDQEHFADVAIRTHDWKLIHRRAHRALDRWAWHNNFRASPQSYSEYELYHLGTDPRETNNIYTRERENPEIIYLEEKLKQWEREQFKMKLPAQTTLEIQPYF